MHKYIITNIHTGFKSTATLEEAAFAAVLLPEEVEWAIEEYGICQTDEHEITEIETVPAMSLAVRFDGRAK